MIKDLLKDAEHRMHSAVTVLEQDLAGVRTGRANPALVEKLHVEYFGMETPLIQLATISIPEPRQILIKPFDKTTLKGIEKAILASDLGLTPNNDGQAIRLILPPLTGDRRRDLVKHVHNRLEEARVALRNIRRDVLKDMKEYENEKMISEDEHKRGEEELQKMMDKVSVELERIGQRKEQEIMEI